MSLMKLLIPAPSGIWSPVSSFRSQKKASRNPSKPTPEGDLAPLAQESSREAKSPPSPGGTSRSLRAPKTPWKRVSHIEARSAGQRGSVFSIGSLETRGWFYLVVFGVVLHVCFSLDKAKPPLVSSSQ